jgi:hypothetical protein
MGAVGLSAATLAASAVVEASSPNWTPVPAPQSKATGIAQPNALPPELAEVVVAQGSNAIENPSGLVTRTSRPSYLAVRQEVEREGGRPLSLEEGSDGHLPLR